MDLIDEQHIVALQVRQQRCQVSRPFQHRPAGLAQVHLHFVRDDVCERGLAQAGRAEQQHMVERLGSATRGLDEDLELLADALLSDVFGQPLRAQRALDRLLVGRGCRGCDQAFVVHLALFVVHIGWGSSSSRKRF